MSHLRLMKWQKSNRKSSLDGLKEFKKDISKVDNTKT